LPYIISSLGFLAYWTYFESTTGQSIGKRLSKIKTTDLGGRKIDAKSAVHAINPCNLNPNIIATPFLFPISAIIPFAL
jgi:RDD family